MPRFVVLRHEFSPDDPRESHWDLMLERGDVLRTWACPSAPETSDEMEVRELGDHRIIYLEYEGPLSDDRGAVRRWDEGTYDAIHDLADRKLILFAGRRLRGDFLLEAIADEPQRWRMSRVDG